MKANKGFTLIELMVVILIIGILSAFALPEYTRAMEKARVTEAITIMDSIRKGVDVYVAENGFETVELIGNTGGSAANQLDINVENELNCNTSDNTCKGKYFVFDSYCSSEHQSCMIIAERMGGDYSLAMNKNANSLKWTRNCVWSGDTEDEMGDLICEMLKGQGWDKLTEE